MACDICHSLKENYGLLHWSLDLVALAIDYQSYRKIRFNSDLSYLDLYTQDSSHTLRVRSH